MHASTQEMYKHAIPPQNSIDMFHPPFPPSPSLTSDKTRLERLQGSSNVRINITFRFFRPDFRTETIPRCDCGIPCILRPDMKNRYRDKDGVLSNGISDAGTSARATSTGSRPMVAKYWWACAVGRRNNGKGCKYWKVMDVKVEGRGPFVTNIQRSCA
ncbi:hypothetical protein C8Q77DRAFT_1094744 [Trametes polyzona]|nr:hypothetical protein C8Q77DRAFT_1094744 [Trametes polyzona]